MNENQQTAMNLPAMTWEQFYEQCKPEGLIMQFRMVTTVFQSVKTERWALGHLRSQFGEYNHKTYGKCDCMLLYMYEWLDYLNNVSNINKPLPPNSMKQLAYILCAKYYYFYFSDLKLILEWILEAKYGVFYGSVDAQLIMRAFKDYSEERKKQIKELERKKNK